MKKKYIQFDDIIEDPFDGSSKRYQSDTEDSNLNEPLIKRNAVEQRIIEKNAKVRYENLSRIKKNMKLFLSI